MNVVSGGTGPQCRRVINNIHESMEEIFFGHDGSMEEMKMEVGRVGVECV